MLIKAYLTEEIVSELYLSRHKKKIELIENN